MAVFEALATTMSSGGSLTSGAVVGWMALGASVRIQRRFEIEPHIA